MHSGHDPASITSLALLVEPLANARAILAFFRDRGMIAKNRHRLRALTNRRTRTMLLHLPLHLMALANHPDTKPAEAARLAMQAVIFEILNWNRFGIFNMPIRVTGRSPI